MNQYFCPAAIEESNFPLSELKDYYLPPDGDLQSYKVRSCTTPRGESNPHDLKVSLENCRSRCVLRYPFNVTIWPRLVPSSPTNPACVHDPRILSLRTLPLIWQEFIKRLPKTDHPAAFGQHVNADITSLIDDAHALLGTMVGTPGTTGPEYVDHWVYSTVFRTSSY